MTTTFEVIIAGQAREYARQASAAAFREIDHIEKLLNKYDAGSDVGQINLLKPGESVRVGIETLECMERAIWAHTVSGGLFDPTVGTGFQWLDIDRTHFSIGWKKDAAVDVQTGRCESRSAPTRSREKSAPQLDLGGIGKGFAIDKAAEVLADWEVKEVVINGGTSTVLALGKEWNLGVGGPWGEKVGLTTITLKNQALSGSGTEVKGKHIVNPKTGKPARRHLAAWAIHPSAATSDALSTAFMMMAPEKIAQLCATNPGTGAFVVLQDESLVKIGV
ncbi:MAG: FAD:protein FMN transferase [Verrucomicrobia bacterium]|nr:FAD:protein FMN transferase [Verrucomicrobiota bacterium]